MKLLITATSGFIGSHILKYALNNTDYEIICLNRSVNNERLQFSVDGVENWNNRITFIEHDLSNSLENIEKLKDIDYVINTASISDVDLSIENPSSVIFNNVSLICNLLDWVKNNNIKKFIHISSVETYGPYIEKMYSENDSHICNNPYAASKASQEDIISAYWSVYNIPLAIVTIGDPFGETQPDTKYLPNTVKKILNDETILVHASPESEAGTRQWIYAGNLADAVLYCLKLDFSNPYQSRFVSKWNLSGDIRFNNLDWAKNISKYMGKELKYKFIDFHTGKLGHGLHYAMDNKKILDSGWSPPFSIEESLGKTVKWYIKKYIKYDAGYNGNIWKWDDK